MKENCRGGKIFIFITSLWFITLTYKAVQLNSLDLKIISFHWRSINTTCKRSHLSSWSVIKASQLCACASWDEHWDKSPSPHPPLRLWPASPLSIGGRASVARPSLSLFHLNIKGSSLSLPQPPLPFLVFLETIFYFIEIVTQSSHLSWYIPARNHETMSLFRAEPPTLCDPVGSIKYFLISFWHQEILRNVIKFSLSPPWLLPSPPGTENVFWNKTTVDGVRSDYEDKRLASDVS